MQEQGDNPLVPAILQFLRDSHGPVSEHELISWLRERAGESGSVDSHLALFQWHFSVMNALYQLRGQLLADGWWLRISPLSITLEPARGESRQGLPDIDADAPLRDWYLDWDNYHNTGEAEVEALLKGFWKRFSGVEQTDAALEELELPSDADWPAIQRRYRQLAARHHPDRGGESHRFIALREAYETLKQTRAS